MNRSEQNAKALEILASVMPDGQTSIADVQAYQAAILADVSRSLAQVADALTEKHPADSGTTAQWVHSEAHKVKCSKCGCQVSMKAAYNMKYCFECGAKMVSSEKQQEV